MGLSGTYINYVQFRGNGKIDGNNEQGPDSEPDKRNFNLLLAQGVVTFDEVVDDRSDPFLKFS